MVRDAFLWQVSLLPLFEPPLVSLFHQVAESFDPVERVVRLADSVLRPIHVGAELFFFGALLFHLVRRIFGEGFAMTLGSKQSTFVSKASRFR